MNIPSAISLPFSSQEETRLKSRDHIWIVTDIYSYSSSYYDYSSDQEFFRVGAVDLRTCKIGYVRFSIDDARAMIRAGVPQPSWNRPLATTIEVCRAAHQNPGPGRFHVVMTLDQVPPSLLAIGAAARQEFDRWGHRPNAKPGMWQEIVDAAALNKLIRDTALGMNGPFSAGDVKEIVGVDVNVTPVLQQLVKEDRLIQSGEKKGTRYRIAPSPAPWSSR